MQKKTKCIGNHITMMNYRKSGCTLKDVWIPKIDGWNWQNVYHDKNSKRIMRSISKAADAAKWHWMFVWQWAHCSSKQSLAWVTMQWLNLWAKTVSVILSGIQTFSNRIIFQCLLDDAFSEASSSGSDQSLQWKNIELARKDSSPDNDPPLGSGRKPDSGQKESKPENAGTILLMRLRPGGYQISDGFEFGQRCPWTDRKYHRPSSTPAAESHATSVYQVANMSPETPWNHQTS